MNCMRKVLGFATMLLLAAFALSSGAAFAADKHYTIAMTSTGASPASVTATFTNSGNSSFNSLTLSLPASGYSLASGATVTSSRGQATIVAGHVQVLSINLPTGNLTRVTMAPPARRRWRSPDTPNTLTCLPGPATTIIHPSATTNMRATRSRCSATSSG